MPRFSVIVPTFRVQGYVRPCLESVLRQDFRDIEIIAVDDCSPDNSGHILDELAARDARLTVHHLPENGGLGRARNAGMARATGDYLLFLDSDDLLAPGTLAALAARLDATGDPDVLLFDYARLRWDGALTRNRRADVLAGAPDGAFRAADHPSLLAVLPVAWNKAYRRGFVAERGLEFPPGWYEDAPWTYPVLLSAERIAVLDRVGVHYRQRREGGNILHTVSRSHFDVLDQYGRVFAFLETLPEDERARWHGPLFGRMVKHLLTVLDRPDRLPAADRAEFFRRAAADYRSRRPSGHRPASPATAAGRKEALLARGGTAGWAGYLALRTAARAARRAAALLGACRRWAARRALRLYCALQRQLPLDPTLAVFCADGGRSRSGCPAAIDDELALLAPEFRRVWVVAGPSAPGPSAAGPAAPAPGAFPGGARRVAAGSRAYWRALARAAYVVADGDLPAADAAEARKRRGQVHVQTHRATPLALAGADQLARPAGRQPADPAAALARCDRWDWSLSANRHSSEVHERAFPGRFRTLETGSPRNDLHYRADAEEVLRARRDLGLPDGALAVLYAPVQRDWEREGAGRDRLDAARFLAKAGEGTVLLMRAPAAEGAGLRVPAPEGAGIPAEFAGRVRDVSAHPSLPRLCLAADALLTDYSPLMFDFANLDRPIVCLTEDWDVYRTVRGAYFALPDEPPGQVCTDPGEAAALFRDGGWDDARSRTLRAAFRERFCAFDDGAAAERVVRTVFLGDTGVEPPLAAELRRPAPAPREAPALALAAGGAREDGEAGVPGPASTESRTATRPQ